VRSLCFAALTLITCHTALAGEVAIAPQTPRVVSDGANFVVLWNSGGYVNAIESSTTLVADDGTRLATLHWPTPPQTQFHDIEWDQWRYVIAWYYRQSEGNVTSMRLRTAAIDPILGSWTVLWDIALPGAGMPGSPAADFRLLSTRSGYVLLHPSSTPDAERVSFINAAGILEKTVEDARAIRIVANGSSVLVLRAASATMISDAAVVGISFPEDFSATDAAFSGDAYDVVGISGQKVAVLRLFNERQALSPPVVLATVAGPPTALPAQGLRSSRGRSPIPDLFRRPRGRPHCSRGRSLSTTPGCRAAHCSCRSRRSPDASRHRPILRRSQLTATSIYSYGRKGRVSSVLQRAGFSD
jgi:hypothetical protein